MTRGQAMRKARKDAGLRLRDLAFMTEVACETIRRAETDKGNPSIEIVELCADALGISIDEYVGHHKRRIAPDYDEDGENI